MKSFSSKRTSSDFMIPWARFKKRPRNENILTDKLCRSIDKLVRKTSQHSLSSVRRYILKKIGNTPLTDVYLDLCIERILIKTRPDKIPNKIISESIVLKALEVINSTGCNMPRDSLMNILELELKLTIDQRKKLQDRLFYCDNPIFFDENSYCSKSGQHNSECSYIVDIGDNLDIWIHKDGMDIFYSGKVIEENTGSFKLQTTTGSVVIDENNCTIVKFTKVL